jgi:hypothetical protein
MKRAPALAALFVLAGVLGARPPLQAQAPSPTTGDLDPRIVKLVDSVSEARLKTLLEKLTSFGTRNTLSNADSPTRGIGAARQWILDELTRTSPKLQVSFDTHQIPPAGRITRPVELRNVMAILPGKSPRRIYVSGHYDSLNLGPRGQMAGATRPATNGAARPGAAGATGAGAAPQGVQPAGTSPLPTDYEVDAPGANDDGSGTVLTMELARAFAESGIEFDATLVFLCHAGEEQGLIGAKAHADAAKEKNIPIQAVFNNDIVGNATAGNGMVDAQSVRVYSEGPEDSASRAIARFVVRQAARYVPAQRVRPMARSDRFGRGGDHSAYNQAGFPAIGFREARENFSKQHGAEDTIDGVSFPYLARNARVNAASMAVLALAPPPPAVASDRGAPLLGRQPSGYDAALRWTASPGAVAYRIFWRDAWAQDWEHELSVGNVTEFVLPNVSIDDYVFGVAAIGAGGHESTVAAYVTPARRF